jgi:hypothetical protein
VFIVKTGIKYKLIKKNIPNNTPVFLLQPKDGNETVTNYSQYPIGLSPLFSLSEFANSKIVLSKVQNQQLDFVIDDKYKLSIYHFYYKESFKASIDKSLDIFYDNKKLNKINEFLSSLKLVNLVIQKQGEEYLNPKIDSFYFYFDSLTIKFSSNGIELKKTFLNKPDASFEYDDAWPFSRAKKVFNLSIYYSDCYSKSLETFNSLTLSKDAINDPVLKQKLLTALKESPDWFNFTIEKVILTNKSQWVIITNKYTGLKENRFLLADAYVKSTINNKCYYHKDLYFSQKADPVDGFIYSIFVAIPQTLQPYPCNLK